MPGVPPNTIVTLMGPTAAGKTDLALALAELIDVDIISVPVVYCIHSTIQQL